MARRQGGADDPRTFGEAFQVRWSKAPDQKKRNYGEVFHNSPGFDALHMIAQDVANARFELYDRRSYLRNPAKATEYKNHPILDFLADPCPRHKELDGFMVHYMTTAYLSMVGEFFWVLERNAQGYPVAAYPVLPTWVVQTWSVTFPYYRIIPQGVTSNREIIVEGDDIIWFKNPSLVDPFGRGRGRDEAIGDELESDEYAAKYQKNLFYNDGQPPMIVSMPDAGRDVVENLKETWIQKVTGWMNARKPMFTNSKVEVQRLTDSVREMDMVESRKALRDIFNQHYALPPEMRGILENSNRATIDSADYLYKKNVLTRMVTRYLQILNRQLVPQFDDTLILVADDIVPADEEKKKADALAAFTAGILKENEVREIFGWPVQPDGDERKKTPAPGLPEKPEPVAEPPKPKPKSVKADTPGQGILPFDDAQADKDKAWARFDRKATKDEAEFKRAARDVAILQKREFWKAFRKSFDAGADAVTAIERASEEVYGLTMDEATAAKIAPAWSRAVTSGYEIADAMLGGGVAFDLYRDEFSAWVESHGLEMAKEINGTTRDKLLALRPEVQVGMESGWSMQKLRNHLNAVYDQLGTTRAELIARTEVLSSINHGQYKVYAGEGVQKKEWVHAGVGVFSRETHMHVAGPIGIHEKFQVEGAPDGMMYPGDPAGGAVNVCNCRCTIYPVLEV